MLLYMAKGNQGRSGIKIVKDCIGKLSWITWVSSMASQILKSGRERRGGQRHEMCDVTRTQSTVAGFEEEVQGTQKGNADGF